jgi:hypothetical protein
VRRAVSRKVSHIEARFPDLFGVIRAPRKRSTSARQNFTGPTAQALALKSNGARPVKAAKERSAVGRWVLLDEATNDSKIATHSLTEWQEWRECNTGDFPTPYRKCDKNQTRFASIGYEAIVARFLMGAPVSGGRDF